MMGQRIRKMWKENKSFLMLLCLMFVFRSAVADWSHVPTGSMKPTILEGDHLLINKMAYDIRVPFTHISIVKLADPKRGDIIIFDSDVLDKRLVKRVIGVPGDWVEMKYNTLYINGQKLEYSEMSSTDLEQDKQENLLGKEHSIRVRKTGSIASNFPPTQVPNDHYLALGDNRDNSSDSRVFGFVPRNEIVGQSKRTLLSLNYDNYYLPRAERFLHIL